MERNFGWLNLLSLVNHICRRIASNQMLLNFGRTRSPGKSSHKIAIAGHRRRNGSLQRIGEPRFGHPPSGVLRPIDTLVGSPKGSLCELGRVKQALSKAGPWRSRERRFRELGMLVQIDGSHHRRLDEQGPQFTLLLAVDGTTSAVANAVFRPEEDTRGYFVLMQGLIQR